MSTNLGDVWAELRIDTKKAERDLDEMERKAKTSGQKRERGETQAQGIDRGDASGSPEETTSARLRPKKFKRKDMTGLEKLEYDRLREMRRLRGVLPRRAARFARGRTAGAAGRPGGSFLAGGAAGRISAVATGTLVRAGGIAAGIYLGARTAAHVASIGAEFLEGLTGGALPDSITSFAKAARARFDQLESEIMAIFRGAKRTMEFVGAAARITGQVPNLGHYYGTFQRIESDTSQLDKRFAHFKRDQVVQAMGRTLGKMVAKELSN